MRFALLLLILLLTACVQPTSTPTATPAGIAGEQTITLLAPIAGVTTSSPLVIRGTTSSLPAANTLTYRVFDAQETLLGSGSVAVTALENGSGLFDAPITYRAISNGPGRIEVLEMNPTNGEIRAVASVMVVLSTSSALPATLIPGIATALPLGTAAPQLATPLPARITPLAATTIASNGQAITIETPPVGTIVGSPVTITGRTTRDPASGQLAYLVRDATGTQIGAGTIQTIPTSNGASFTGSLTFVEPNGGGQVVVDIADPGNAQASIQLLVAPPQAITFETPAVGTLVGSPMTITGRTARLPFQGALSYRIYDASNIQLGAGLVFVQGQPGQLIPPGRFVAEVTFTPPATLSDIRVELSDEDAISGAVAARQSLIVRASPQTIPAATLVPTAPAQPGTQVPLPATAIPQAGTIQITIDSPIALAQVASPFTMTGKVSAVPAAGLRYRVRDANGRIIGEGLVPVSGSVGQAGQFSSVVGFTLQQDGPIVLEIGEPDTSGNLKSAALVVLNATKAAVTGYPAP